MKLKARHKLRQPGGPHLVGCTQFFYEYGPGEKDNEKRVIPCLCFYPAKSAGRGNIKKYASERILPGAGGIETNANTDAPVCEGRHPLLLFSHGFSLGCEANTVQCEELASHGYLILSVGHQDDGSYELPDGSILLFEMEKKTAVFQADVKATRDLLPQYAAWLNGDGKKAGRQEHYAHYQKIIDSQPEIVARTEIWLKDSLVALERFLNGEGPAGATLGNHVDRQHIGAFGMSLGGATALGLAQVSDLIKAAANLDGFYYSDAWREPIKKPVLLLQHDGADGYFLTFPFLNAAHDAYLATFKDSRHCNFMDYNEILADNPVARVTIDGEEVAIALLGGIEPSQMESIMNTLLLDFFDKYLRGKASHVIDTDALPEGVDLLRKR